jgi:hypothetical protein
MEEHGIVIAPAQGAGDSAKEARNPRSGHELGITDGCDNWQARKRSTTPGYDGKKHVYQVSLER